MKSLVSLVLCLFFTNVSSSSTTKDSLIFDCIESEDSIDHDESGSYHNEKIGIIETLVVTAMYSLEPTMVSNPDSVVTDDVCIDNQNGNNYPCSTQTSDQVYTTEEMRYGYGRLMVDKNLGLSSGVLCLKSFEAILIFSVGIVLF